MIKEHCKKIRAFSLFDSTMLLILSEMPPLQFTEFIKTKYSWLDTQLNFNSSKKLTSSTTENALNWNQIIDVRSTSIALLKKCKRGQLPRFLFHFIFFCFISLVGNCCKILWNNYNILNAFWKQCALVSVLLSVRSFAFFVRNLKKNR